MKSLRCAYPNNPEFVGTSQSPQAETNGKRLLSGNTLYAASAVFDHSDITPETVDGLSLKYGFELIPADNAVVIAAGYTPETAARAQVWYGPVMDDDNFYYVAYIGAVFKPDPTTFLPSLLVSRKRSNGELNYVANTNDYNLDTSLNYLGINGVIARACPAIHDNTIYLSSAIVSNVGPQLFAVNKNTGKLKWAIAYYPPVSAPQQYYTTKADYGEMFGVLSNHRVADLAISVYKYKGKTTVLVGVSSNQIAIGSNVAAIGINNKYPVYTDQGFLFAIEDKGAVGKLLWKTPTCAPLLKKGDFISSTGPDRLNPFPPGKKSIVIGTYTTSTIRDPHVFTEEDPIPNAPLNVTAFLQNFVLYKSTNLPILLSLWSHIIGPVLSIQYSDGVLANELTWDQVLNILVTAQNNLSVDGNSVFSVLGYLDVDNTLAIKNIDLTGTGAQVFYFKDLFDKTKIKNTFDANALNYYGNTVWGEVPCVDLPRGLIYFGTGQAHAVPFYESQLYSQKEFNYFDYIKPLIDAQNQYVAGNVSLPVVLSAEDYFTSAMKRLSVSNKEKSPRGLMSYSDALFAVKIETGHIAFAVRSLPADTYSFVFDPSVVLYPGLRGIDGDVSSGVKLYDLTRKYLTSPAKSGCCPIIDFTDYNSSVVFNHKNLVETGVFYAHNMYVGTTTAIGGSNYSCASSTGKLLLCNQLNQRGTPTGTNPNEHEIYVNRDGVVYPVGNSYVMAINVENASVEWISSTNTFSAAGPKVVNGLALVNDRSPTLRALHLYDGSLKWLYNGAGGSYPMGGGFSGPAIGKGNVIWISDCPLPGVPFGPGKWGICLEIDNCAQLPAICSQNLFKKLKDILVGHTFVNFVPIPFPSTVTHNWKFVDNDFVLAVNELFPLGPVSYQFIVKGVDGYFIQFKNNKVTVGDVVIVYKSLQIVTRSTYVLKYTVDGGPELVLNFELSA